MTDKKKTGADVYAVIEQYAAGAECAGMDLNEDSGRATLAGKMAELYRVISAISGKQPQEATSEEQMKEFMQTLGADIFYEMRREAAFIGMKNAVKIIVWRSGFLFALSPNLRNEKLNNRLEELLSVMIGYDQKNYRKPNRPLFEKLVESYAELDEAAAERQTDMILRDLGVRGKCLAAYAKDSVVSTFGHPVDAKIVKVLDNGAVNGAIRAYVSLTADAFMGQRLASGIRVNERNYPEINRIVDECVGKLKIQRPYVVVSSEGGVNAMAFGSDEEPYIILTSLLVKIMNEDQLRFVIGHECGHIAMGHVMYHTAANLLSILGKKIFILDKAVSAALGGWSRRSEITADRAGLVCCGDVDIARKALIQLECPHRNAEEMDVDAYMQSSREFLSKGTLRKLGEYSASHPLTPKRIEAITAFADSRIYYETMGRPVPENAIAKDALTRRVEEILKVL